jgi:uncharacterized protein (DUF4415 family)
MQSEYDFSQGKRGAINSTPTGQTRITLTLDDDVIDWFRDSVHQTGGGNYQALINNALHQYISNQQEPLEDTLRRVVREELDRVAN